MSVHLMGLSDTLGALNYERFQEWQAPFNTDNARPAVLAFKGDVYQGLDAANMTDGRSQLGSRYSAYLIRPLWRASPAGFNATLSP